MDIRELDFEDMSVLSDLNAFKRAAKEQRSLDSQKDAHIFNFSSPMKL